MYIREANHGYNKRKASLCTYAVDILVAIGEKENSFMQRYIG